MSLAVVFKTRVFSRTLPSPSQSEAFVEESVWERLPSGLGTQELLQNEFITVCTVVLGAAQLGCSEPDFRASLASRQDPGQGSRC